MAPLRVVIIGLGAVSSETFRPGEWGIQHLNSLKDTPHCRVVGVCNSSAASAQRSIDAHKLGPEVKAYNSPEEVAKDPNVDFVVVAVRISRHYEIVKTLLENRKNILVEFPVAPTLEKEKELVSLAKSNGVTAIVGSQGRADPIIKNLRELVKSGAIGDVTVSSFTGQTPVVVAEMWPESQLAFLEEDSGVNKLNVLFGHILDTHMSVLGRFKDVQSTLKTQTKLTNIIDDAGKVVKSDYQVTSPDTILVQAVQENGAVSSFTFRSSPVPVDGKGARWLISGTKGELELTGGVGIFHMGLPDAKLTLRTWGGEAKDIDVTPDEPAFISKVPPPGGNTARIYEAFATGQKEGYATLDFSLEVHEVIDKIRSNALRAD